MGNQQTLNYSYYSFAESDSDSGFGELSSSPFELNKNTSFNYLYETDKSSQQNTKKLLETPVQNTFNPETIIQRSIVTSRKNSLIKSKSIGINISSKKGNSTLNDSFEFDDNNNNNCEICYNCNDCISSSVHSKSSITSSSWSPNSSVLTNQKALIEDKTTSNKTTTPNTTPTTTPKTSSTYPLSFLSGMNYLGRVARGVKDFYNEINPATLTGAIDVVVVQQEDGSFRCSPFHVRFGKLGVIRSKEKIVDLEINGQKVEDLHMILGEAGEAFFVEKVVIDSDGNEYVTSCDLSNVTSSELSALIAAASNSSSLSIKTESLSATITSLAKNSDNLVIENKTVSAKSTLAASISAFDLTTESPDKTIVKSRETTPQKSQPIPISGSKLIATEASSTPLTIITNTPSTSRALIASPDSSDKVNSDTLATHVDITNKPHNFFSDGELTPELTSPAVSRPPTPKSDTELEVYKIKRSNTTNDVLNQWNWQWGELPSRQNNTSVKFTLTDSSTSQTVLDTSTESNSSQQKGLKTPNTEFSAKSPSKLLGMFSLMGKNTTSPNPNGIYLDETEKLDSEVAALYLDQKSNSKFLASNQSKTVPHLQLNKDDDQESGNGQSLPQSPLRDYYSIIGDVQLSLCGFVFNSNNQNLPSLLGAPSDNQSLVSNSASLLAIPQSSQLVPNFSLTDVNSNQQQVNESLTPMQQMNFEDLFQQHSVSYEKFVEEISSITLNPNLIIKINNKYMTWPHAAPIILSAVVFHKNLSNELVTSLLDASAVTKSIKPQESTTIQPQAVVDKKASGVWSKIFGARTSTVAATLPESTTNMPATLTTISAIQKQTTTTTTTTTVTTTVQTNLVSVDTNTNDNELVFNDDLIISNIQPETPEINYNKDLSNENSASSEKHIHHMHHLHQTPQPSSLIEADDLKPKEEVKYRKTTRLSSDLISKLNLQPGSNEIQYSVTTALQGTTKITSYIFLWYYDDKVIVSDIDGTITKSDVWGQVLPIFGRDWSQAGVADLFTAIERNQYKFMYLSARAIGQSKITRDLLRSINQDGFTLPEGPLLVTPTSLFTAFQKEVIEKKPEEFKISCLKDIQSLFPSHNPYYAGYGNKTSDVKSYKTVGISESRIFTINPQGEVKHEVSGAFQSSYSKLCDYVDLIFPPFKAPLEIKAEYDSFNYWRGTTPSSIMDEIEKEIAQSLKESKETKDNLKDSKKAKTKSQSVKLKPQVSAPLAITSAKNGSSNPIVESN